MELQEMQETWREMSLELEKQKKLTATIIIKMTQEKYKNKFRTITVFETIGTVICFIAALFILLNFTKLNTWYLVACGLITLGYLTILPILVLRSLYRIKNLNLISKNYKETLYSYTKEKKQLLLLQKLGVFGSFLVLFSSLPVFSKISSNKDFFKMDLGLSFYIILIGVLIFLYFFTRWGYKSYMEITNSAELILNELE
tara:strand:+ start:259029 stop:259628 length:600 start_codon:yes stop_codon:yes gene_type:complete